MALKKKIISIALVLLIVMIGIGTWKKLVERSRLVSGLKKELLIERSKTAAMYQVWLADSNANIKEFARLKAESVRLAEENTELAQKYADLYRKKRGSKTNNDRSHEVRINDVLGRDTAGKFRFFTEDLSKGRRYPR
jgi:hypothetical protein